jgi:HEAT repeat protein
MSKSCYDSNSYLLADVSTNKIFEMKLQEIVDGVDSQFPESTQQAVKAVFASGIHSYEEWRSALENPKVDIDVRSTICWALARLRDERSLPAMLTALNDPSEKLRGEAAIQLGVLDAQKAVLPLIESLQNDSDTTVREVAANSLGSLRNPLATPILIKIMQDPTETPGLRGHAAEALGGIRGEEVITPLITALQDEVVDVRFWAAFALGQLGDPQALPELERLAATDTAVLPGWGPISQEAEEAVAGIKYHLQQLQDEDETS